MSHPDPLHDPENVRDEDGECCDCGECGECLDMELAPDDFDESMDGDHESGLASAGWGTDEDYGCYDSGDDW